MTNRDIATTLFISPKTVEHHIGRIYRKLGIRSSRRVRATDAAISRHPSSPEPGPAPAARHVRRRDDRAGLDDRRGHLRRTRPGGRGGGIGSAHRARPRRRRRLLQRHVLGAAGRAATRSPAAPTCTAGNGSASSGATPAGWSFVVGKTASCAAMALTVGVLRLAGQAHAVAVAAVVALTAVNYAGIQKSALLTRVIVAVVLAVLAAVVVVILGFGDVDAARLAFGDDVTAGGVLQAAGLAVLRVRRLRAHRHPRRGGARSRPHHPARHPDRAGHHTGGLRGRRDRRAGRIGQRRLWLPRPPRWPTRSPRRGCPASTPVVRVGAAVAALGSLLALILGVSRTTLAMARDRHLPHALAAVHPRFGSPHRAELAVGVVVAVVAAVGRRARRDRLLVVRGAAVLRDRQRIGVDAGRRVIPGVGTGGLPAAGVPVAAVVGRDRGGRGARRRADLLRCAGRGRPPPRSATS